MGVTVSVNIDMLWEELLHFIDEGSVVPVIGQDLLTIGVAGREVLLYTYLAERLAASLGVEPELRGDNPLNTMVCRYVERGNPIKKVQSALTMLMPSASAITLPDPLLKLAEIDQFHLFVTTTFDSLLIDSLNRQRFGGRNETTARAYALGRFDDIPSNGGDGGRSDTIVYQLLGRLGMDPTTAAVTDEDILEFIHRLQKQDHAPKVLFGELCERHLLVIGCGFPDWLARFFIRLAQQKRIMDSDKQAWIVDGRIGASADLMSFLQHFSPMTQVFPGDPLAFVDELHRRWTKRHPGGPDARLLVPDSDARASDGAPRGVFLSYASEDRSAAEALRNSLREAGIDVWFDKDRLEAGDRWSATIKRNIHESAVFVPILSKHTLTPFGREFRKEWNAAIEDRAGRRPDLAFIVPVAIDDIPAADPGVPEEFRACHWSRLSDSQDTGALVERLKQCVRKYRSVNQGTA